MLFVHDNGRCAHIGSARTAPDFRYQGIYAALLAYARAHIFKLRTDLERTRLHTYTTEYFLNTHRRQHTLPTISLTLVI